MQLFSKYLKMKMNLFFLIMLFITGMMLVSCGTVEENSITLKQSYQIPPAPTAAQIEQAIASFPKAAGINLSVNKNISASSVVVPEWGYNGWCENPGTPVQYIDWQTWVNGSYPQIWQYNNWIYSFKTGVWRLMTVAREGQKGGVFLRYKYKSLPEATPGYDYLYGAIHIIYHANTATGERIDFGYRYIPNAFLTYYDPNY